MKQVLILFLSMSFGVIPKTYQIENSNELEFSDGLLSNTVIDIEYLNDQNNCNSIFLGTSQL